MSALRPGEMAAELIGGPCDGDILRLCPGAFMSMDGEPTPLITWRGADTYRFIEVRNAIALYEHQRDPWPPMQLDDLSKLIEPTRLEDLG